MDVVNSTDANYKNNWGETYNSSNPSMSIEAYKNIVPDFSFLWKIWTYFCSFFKHFDGVIRYLCSFSC